MHARLAEHRDLEIGLERVDLAAERVALHRDVEPAEGLLSRDAVGDAVGEQDQPGARAVHRHARRDRVADRLAHAERARELVDDARLAAGDHEAVDARELGRAAHQVHVRAELGQHARVLADVALEGEDADARAIDVLSDRAVRRYQPRSARRCGAARSVTLMPTMASPRPRDTSAMTFASS